MKLEPALYEELSNLLEGVCEDRLTDADASRLQDLLTRDPAARAFYRAYIDLHGTLYWDAGVVASSLHDGSAELSPSVAGRNGHAVSARSASFETPHRRRQMRAFAGWSTALGLVLVVGLLVARGMQPANAPDNFADNHAVNVEPHQGSPAETNPQRVEVVERGPRKFTLPALEGNQPREEEPTATTIARAEPQPEVVAEPVAVNPLPGASSLEVLVSFVNDKMHQGWQAAGVTPSPRADDAEWLRRVYLDLVGHIPPVDVLDRFLADRDSDKRGKMIDRLLDDPDYTRHFATIWTNLLVGQNSPPEVARDALMAYLRRSFYLNRPWTQMVSDLVAADGRSDENGAANFLLAHLNDKGIAATAITARLFMGRQVQCTQCHNHPSNDWKQDQFWQLNSFFAQADIVRQEKFDPTLGQMMLAAVELRDQDVGGPVFFETRTGLMKAAYPVYGSVAVDADPAVNRRRELARLITTGNQPPVADAFVNRLWAHFFGSGFTQQVDDMGPHAPASHPELLARLSQEFAQSGCDIKQLIRVICQSEAYHLTSRSNGTNTQDDPTLGDLPLFSHMYVKPMSPEQLYDSLVIATQGQGSMSLNWSDADTKRREWVRQFVETYDTEQNDESMHFGGSIPQSLMMKNNELNKRALSAEPGTFLHKLLTEVPGETERSKRLYLSALSRPPTAKELTAVRKLLRSGASRPRTVASTSTRAYQDVYWAFLNSNEFILNH